MKKRVTCLMIFLMMMSIFSCDNKISESGISSPSKDENLSLEKETSSSSYFSSSNLQESVSETSSDSSSIASSSSEANQISSFSPIYTYENCLTTKKLQTMQNLKYRALFDDLNFKKGFYVSKTSTNAEGGNIYQEALKHYPQNQDVPSWTIAQWSSKHDLILEGYNETSSDNNLIYTYTSLGGAEIDGNFLPAKKLSFNSITGELYLEANTQVEYDHPRLSSEGWVHLLLSQSFNNHLINVSSLTSLRMDATYTIEKFDDLMGEEANSSRHAAQLVWYITLQNRNEKSDEYGKYIWFGLCLWDNRQVGKTKNLYAAIDQGTSSLMYNPSSLYYLKDNNGYIPEVGQKVNASIEVLNFALLAYQENVSRGNFVTTKFEDLYIGGMNFGFEIPGTYNVGARFEDIGVYYQ